MTPEADKARRRRNVAIAAGIALFVVLVFLITIVRLHGAALDRPL